MLIISNNYVTAKHISSQNNHRYVQGYHRVWFLVGYFSSSIIFWSFSFNLHTQKIKFSLLQSINHSSIYPSTLFVISRNMNCSIYKGNNICLLDYCPRIFWGDYVLLSAVRVLTILTFCLGICRDPSTHCVPGFSTF